MKATLAEISAAELRSILSYDRETGIFVWLVRRGQIAAGTIAGNIRPDGRRIIKINHRNYLASRLAWLHVHGTWPESEIDHEDRVRGNDRLDNLRPATRQQNMQNTGTGSHNSLGLRGICRKRKGFQARVFVDGAYVLRKTFRFLEDAVQARDAAYRLHFGEFCPSFAGG